MDPHGSAMRIISLWRHFCDSQNTIFHLKSDIVPRKGQPIGSLRVILIGGSGIVFQNADDRILFFKRDFLQKRFGEIHLQ